MPRRTTQSRRVRRKNTLKKLFCVLSGSALIVVVTCTSVLAADFWEAKPFMTWSDKELQQLLADSPWSRTLTIVVNSPGRGGNLGEADIFGGGGRSGTDFGPGDAGNDAARGVGVGGRSGNLSLPPQLKLAITWRSALPMKHGLVRSQAGANGVVSAEARGLLERREEAYILSVEGVPLAFSRAAAAIKAQTFLRRDKKEPIPAADLVIQTLPGSIVLVIAFPKADAITLDDKDVEFTTRLGTIDVKRKFPLKSMVYHGQLEL